MHWDAYLHAWVVTRYADVLAVLQHFSAARTPTPEQLTAMGLAQLVPLAQVMVRQMLFLDPPAHGRIRGLASRAFTPRRVAALRGHIQEIVDSLLEAMLLQESMEIMAHLANPLPAIVTAEILGLPASDHQQLKAWSADFAEVLGNFQHNPDRAARVLRSLEEMCAYFDSAIHEHRQRPRDDVITGLLTADLDGDRLTDEEVVSNLIVTMVGGLETTTNLIGNGLLTLLRHQDQFTQLREEPSLVPSAIEEMLRYESPSQHTARLAHMDVDMGGKSIAKGQAVMAVMAAANRDPERFPDPDRFDIRRPDNRHVAFAWAHHFCFGAPLARLEGQIVFEALLQRMPNLRLDSSTLTWRQNLGLRGLSTLPVTLSSDVSAATPSS
ncbi:MAG TPA: cytochrome P450 [Ktedonobacterales bacterium]|nr:cytochrome P450 [Ktedonobacterales bacterium]